MARINEQRRRQAWLRSLCVCFLGLALAALGSRTASLEAQGPANAVQDTGVFSKAPERDVPSAPVHPGTGFVADSLVLPDVSLTSSLADVAALDLPASWDWRDHGGVTGVRNQGACGSCYAFGMVGTVESRLLIDGSGTLDVSENNAKECNWEELNNYGGVGSCDGGSFRMVANLFTLKGAAAEACDPYVDGDVPCNSSCVPQRTLTGLGELGSGVPDVPTLKWYVQNHGPVAAAMYAGAYDDWGDEFRAYDGSYTLYYVGTEWANHGILIVGWDDSLTHAGGTGAWIVKNSWGSAWGDDGFFTIAYGSAKTGTNSTFASAWQDFDPFGDVLHYDEAGRTSGVGCPGSGTCWGLVRFTVPEDQEALAVEFWTTGATTDVDVYLYDTFDGSAPSGLLFSQLNLSYPQPGYQSVPIVPSLPLESGEDIVVVLKLTNQTATYPVGYDAIGPYESGRTYVSCSGSSGSWEDLGSLFNGDVGFRIRTSAEPTWPAYESPTQRFGVGLQTAFGQITDYDVGSLNIGWYSDWKTTLNPPRPGGIDYAQLIWVDSGTFSPTLATIGDIVANNPGSLWLIGNEPECIWQGNNTPQQYAQVYHQLYPYIKGLDPTAWVAMGGVVQPTPLRLQWLDEVLTYYQATYGEPMPVDVWNIHIQILQEKKNSWGCEIPAGLDATEGRLYGIQDNDSIAIFQQLVQEMRAWMLARGFQDKPLIISEYGVLFPPEYGYTVERVNAFMDASFDYLLSATQAGLGLATDENRLVQQWLWYSLNEQPYDIATGDGFNGALYDYRYPTYPGVITEFGVNFREYLSLSSLIDFRDYAIEPFGGSQDKGTAVIEHEGATLCILGNGWKKISYPYEVTGNTVVEFDFRSEAQGEVHGIGFADSDYVNESRTFRVYGTQVWGIGDFATYDLYAPGWEHFVIPVGRYYHQEMLYLIFANDHDVVEPTAQGCFSNLEVYERDDPDIVDFRDYVIEPFGGTQDQGYGGVGHGGATLHLVGNAWKRIAFPYTVTGSTVIEFDFRSESQGEVHGIGLADSNYVNQSRTFRLYGTQVWGIKDFATYAVFTPAWKHYVIPVGRYYKGDMLYLIFANDHDVPDPTGEGYFSSVRVYERDDPEILNFRDYVIESYGGDEDEGYGGVGHGGATLHLVGNAWKKISFPYTVTGNTVLEFDFRSEAQGEVHAIGLTDSTDLDEPRTFRLYGTEAWGISDFATYDALAPAWEHYVIPLGRYYSGAMSFLIFANDHDVPDPTGEGYFSNVKVFERR